MLFPKADTVANLSLEKFESLPRSGKPTNTEWTVLSCIIQHDRSKNESKVVALGTGTKCIGSDQLCKNGLVLNDSHAEVMARRGFLRYLYYKMLEKDNDLLKYDSVSNYFKLKEEISFHFFSTHPPCGDGTIIDDSNLETPPNKKPKIEESEHNETHIFTGAKLVEPNGKLDLMGQETGAIRTKPGRGVRTLSVSCSDKISRWNILGVQGALIDLFLETPIYLQSFTFCGIFNKESISRAIWKRFDGKLFTNERFHIMQPDIRGCSKDISFKFSQTIEKDPSPASIVWCDIVHRSLEIAVNGKRQGVTKKQVNTSKGSLQICKWHLFKQFLEILSVVNEGFLTKLNGHTNISDLKTYKDFKQLSVKYQFAWNELKTNYFCIWTNKLDDYINFSIEKL